MPVDAVGVDLGQRRRDAQACQLRHAPVVHQLAAAYRVLLEENTADALVRDLSGA